MTLIPDLRTARLPHPQRHGALKTHPVTPISPLFRLCCGKAWCLTAPIHWPLSLSVSTLLGYPVTSQRPTPLSPQLTCNPYNRPSVLHLHPVLLELPDLLTPSNRLTIKRIPVTPIGCPPPRDVQFEGSPTERSALALYLEVDKLDKSLNKKCDLGSVLAWRGKASTLYVLVDRLGALEKGISVSCDLWLDSLRQGKSSEPWFSYV